MSRMTLFACAAALAAGFATTLHAADAIFAANLEAAPDCTSYGAPGCPGFLIETPPIVIQGGQSIAYCYTYLWPNAPKLGVGRFSSTFDPIIDHIVVYAAYNEAAAATPDASPHGTLSVCGDESLQADSGGGGVSPSRRIYQAHEPTEQLRMPADDGSGHPLALALGGGNLVIDVQMYFVNPGPDSITVAPLRLAANGWGDGVAYTQTATFTARATSFLIAPLSAALVARQCPVPAGAKFWWFSTHTHGRALNATVRNGATVLVASNNWDAPSITTFAGPQFYQFAALDQLSYECTFANDLGQSLTYGADYQTKEHCDAVGYYFPADGAAEGCFDDSSSAY